MADVIDSKHIPLSIVKLFQSLETKSTSKESWGRYLIFPVVFVAEFIAIVIWKERWPTSFQCHKMLVQMTLAITMCAYYTQIFVDIILMVSGHGKETSENLDRQITKENELIEQLKRKDRRQLKAVQKRLDLRIKRNKHNTFIAAIIPASAAIASSTNITAIIKDEGTYYVVIIALVSFLFVISQLLETENRLKRLSFVLKQSCIEHKALPKF